MKFVILTGMSGAGKSTAIKMMEDIGFYCVDNLPIPLLEKFVELTTLQSAELQKVAVGIDIRSGQSFDELHGVLDHIDTLFSIGSQAFVYHLLVDIVETDSCALLCKS